MLEIGGRRVALLDTTVLIDLGRGPHARANRNARATVHRLLASGEMLFTSRINEAEFRVGPEMSDNRERELESVESVLAAIVILEFNDKAALRYAVLKAAALRRGRPVGDCDVLIASVALANGQPLLTRNPKHFSGFDSLIVHTY
jgi:predicted nucleic acid-binding protein